MSNKHVLVYGLLESTNDLRNVFVAKIYWNISLLHDQAQEKEMRFLLNILIRTTFRKEIMGQRNLKKLFEFHSFTEIFYCEITRHRNTNLDVFIMSAYKNHYKKRKYGTVYLRNIRNPKNLMNYFTVAWPDSGTRLWIFFKYEAESV